MSEWRRTPLAMHQRRGDGRYGGAEGCALTRAESARARERGGRAAHRAERGEGSRERAQGRETASPMVLHCVVGE